VQVALFPGGDGRGKVHTRDASGIHHGRGVGLGGTAETAGQQQGCVSGRHDV